MAKCDIGIDLGTTNIKIFIKDKGVVIDEPSVVAVKKKTKELVEIGKKAYDMIGKNPDSILVKYPLTTGVISDYYLNELMIKELLSRVIKKSVKKPRICICVHSLITDVERRAVTEAALASGCGKVFLIEEPMASGLGAGLDMSNAKGFLVVNMGGGTTDIAVLSLNGIVLSRSIKTGGQRIDEIIRKNIASNHKLLIGRSSAEKAKIKMAIAKHPKKSLEYELKGRDLITGLPRSVVINQEDIYCQMKESIDEVINNIKNILEETPPELVGDIYASGILLTGGGSLINQLPELITEKIGVKARLADDPKECVVNGVGKSLDLLDNFSSIFLTATA